MAEPQYLAPAFDPTALGSISGSQWYQWFTGGGPGPTVGFVHSTTDVAGVPQVPDAATYTTLQRFAWRRILAASVAWYTWDPNAASDAVYLKWVSLNISGIAPGSIVGSMIANNTITDNKIVSLDWSKITGAPTDLPPSGAAGGDLSGTYPNPIVANLAITTGKINDLAVTNAKIADLTIAFGKLAPSAIGNQILQTNAGATAVGWVTKDIVTLANPASIADVGKVPTVDSPYTNGYVLKTPSTFLGLQTFGPYDLIDGPIANAAHGFAGTPQICNWVLRCTSADMAYAVDDEVSIDGFQYNAGPNLAGLVGGANVSNIFLTALDKDLLVVTEKGSTTTNGNIDPAKWKAYCHAAYIA